MSTHTESAHRFELAGLGKAPFRVIGVEHRVGPIVIRSGGGTEVTVGAPGQPMGSCAFCGQGIAECWLIRSADGKTFIVGCDCVAKTGDAGLKAGAGPFKRKLNHERIDARIEAACATLELENVRAALAAKPSPNAMRTQDSALDWVEWMLKNAGRAGRVKAARLIESERAQ